MTKETKAKVLLLLNNASDILQNDEHIADVYEETLCGLGGVIEEVSDIETEQ